MKCYNKSCVICGSTFTAQRKDAKTCSIECRKKKSYLGRYSRKIIYVSTDKSGRKLAKLEEELEETRDKLNAALTVVKNNGLWHEYRKKVMYTTVHMP